MVLVQQQPKAIKIWSTAVKKVYIWSTQVRPAGWWWWTPWVNTLAYYPLDSTNTVNDLSWNNKTLTNYNVVFNNNSWVDCAYFNGSNASLRNTSLKTNEMTTNFTISLWINQTTIWDRGISSNITWNYYGYILWTDGSWHPKIEIMDSNWNTTNSNYTTSANTWYHIVCTHDSSNSVKIYINWALKNTWSKSFWTANASKFTIWAYYFWADANPWWYFNWYISNFIVENKARTSQDISDYFDQTKWNYWL